jgi:hypothetical protein
VAGRLAALCATGEERTRLAHRLARLALQEQEVIAGSRRIDRDLPERVDELADCLRAVLRDCVVGHLRGDLVDLAEEILDGVADEARPAPAGWPSEREAGRGAASRAPLAGPTRPSAGAGSPAGAGPSADEAPSLEDPSPAEATAGGTASAASPPSAGVPSPSAAASPSDAAAPHPSPRFTIDDAIDADAGVRAPHGAADDLDSVVPEFRPTGEPYPAALRPLDPTGEIRASRRAPRASDLWLDVTWDDAQLGEPQDDEDDDEPGPWPVSDAG